MGGKPDPVAQGSRAGPNPVAVLWDSTNGEVEYRATEAAARAAE